MCLTGVGVFCGTIYRGATLSYQMLEQVFYIQSSWIEPLKLTLMGISGFMGAVGLMILFVGCLATGATRQKVYRAWGARVGGRISCAVFMSISYILQIVWLLIFIFLVIITLVFTVFVKMCSSHRVQNHECLSFRQFDFFFPDGQRPEHMEVCDHKTKEFCKDYVEKAEIMFVLSLIACFFIILSLIHYLMCLSANYAHIRDHEKFQDLQELKYLQGSDPSIHSRGRY